MNKILGSFYIFFLFACGAHSPREKVIFRYNDASGITSLDPVKANNLSNIWAVQQVFNTLVQLDENGNLVPSLATRWEVSEDAAQFTFFLRKDVLFHANKCFQNEQERLLKAADVVFSLQRVAQEPSASWMLNNVASKNGKKYIEAINDSTVFIQLENPSMVFLRLLTMPYGMIVSEKAVGFYGAEFRKNPVGTGPFFLRQWHENEKLVLNKNEAYFEFEEGVRLPYLDGIAVTFIKDRQTELLEFLQGNLEMIAGLDAAFKDELLTYDGKVNEKYSNKIVFIKKPYLNTEYLGFQLLDSESIFKNKYVRQALSFALDRQKIIAMIRNNIGDADVNGILPKALQSQNDTLHHYAYNLSEMKECLEKAGFKHPSEVPAFTLTVDVAYTDLATIILNQWRTVGFSVQLDVVDRPTLKSSVAKGHLSFFRASWIGDYPDAENYLSLFYSENFAPNGPNYTHFKSQNYDELFLKAQQELNDSVRYSMYSQMNNIVMEEAPVIILYYDEIVRFFQTSVKNVTINTMNGLNLTRAKIEFTK